LKKSKKENKTLFIDASNEFVPAGNKNKLGEENIETILNAYIDRKDINHFCSLVDNTAIGENDYNLSVSSYVEREDTREVIDIEKLNAEIAEIVERQTILRNEVDAIVAEFECAE